MLPTTGPIRHYRPGRARPHPTQQLRHASTNTAPPQAARQVLRFATGARPDALAYVSAFPAHDGAAAHGGVGRRRPQDTAREEAISSADAAPSYSTKTDDAIRSLYRGPRGCWRTQERAPARASIHSAFTGSVVTNDSFVSIATQLAQPEPFPESRDLCRVDFTLVTQASAERLWMLDHICQRWHGPIVISVYAPITEKIQTERDKCYPNQVEYIITTVKLHIYSDHSSYPVNKLRNMAISRVRTSHFLHADIDLARC